MFKAVAGLLCAPVVEVPVLCALQRCCCVRLQVPGLSAVKAQRLGQELLDLMRAHSCKSAHTSADTTPRSSQVAPGRADAFTYAATSAMAAAAGVLIDAVAAPPISPSSSSHSHAAFDQAGSLSCNVSLISQVHSDADTKHSSGCISTPAAGAAFASPPTAEVSRAASPDVFDEDAFFAAPAPQRAGHLQQQRQQSSSGPAAGLVPAAHEALGSTLHPTLDELLATVPKVLQQPAPPMQQQQQQQLPAVPMELKAEEEDVAAQVATAPSGRKARTAAASTAMAEPGAKATTGRKRQRRSAARAAAQSCRGDATHAAAAPVAAAGAADAAATASPAPADSCMADAGQQLPDFDENAFFDFVKVEPEAAPAAGRADSATPALPRPQVLAAPTTIIVVQGNSLAAAVRPAGPLPANRRHRKRAPRQGRNQGQAADKPFSRPATGTQLQPAGQRGQAAEVHEPSIPLVPPTGAPAVPSPAAAVHMPDICPAMSVDSSHVGELGAGAGQLADVPCGSEAAGALSVDDASEVMSGVGAPVSSDGSGSAVLSGTDAVAAGDKKRKHSNAADDAGDAVQGQAGRKVAKLGPQPASFLHRRADASLKQYSREEDR